MGCVDLWNWNERDHVIAPESDMHPLTVSPVFPRQTDPGRDVFNLWLAQPISPQIPYGASHI